MKIDWPRLRAAAAEAAGRAYAPYSRLHVGAAGLAGDGRIVTGCNVENASYGLTLCAECGLVSALHASGPAGPAAGHGAPPVPAPGEVPVLVAVAVVAGDGAPLLPCGRCRQLLLEAGGPSLLVDTASGPAPLAELLPAAFSGTDLSSRREAGPEALRCRFQCGRRLVRTGAVAHRASRGPAPWPPAPLGLAPGGTAPGDG